MASKRKTKAKSARSKLRAVPDLDALSHAHLKQAFASMLAGSAEARELALEAIDRVRFRGELERGMRSTARAQRWTATKLREHIVSSLFDAGRKLQWYTDPVIPKGTQESLRARNLPFWVARAFDQIVDVCTLAGKESSEAEALLKLRPEALQESSVEAAVLAFGRGKGKPKGGRTAPKRPDAVAVVFAELGLPKTGWAMIEKIIRKVRETTRPSLPPKDLGYFG